jgi:hypothetical protein
MLFRNRQNGRGKCGVKKIKNITGVKIANRSYKMWCENSNIAGEKIANKKRGAKIATLQV